MKIAVVYYSETGNTKKVAEEIFSAIDGDRTILTLDEMKGAEEYDLIFLGFPLIRFAPPRPVRAFLTKHAAGKVIALFITHAAWETEGEPSPLSTWIEKCESAAKEATLLGTFHCQGELAEEAAKQFLESPIPEVQWFGSLRPATMGHPNLTDLEAARLYTHRVLKKLNP